MTLNEWAKQYSLVVFSHETGAKYVEFNPGSEAHHALFCLDDYIVSSVVAGCVWLCHKS